MSSATTLALTRGGARFGNVEERESLNNTISRSEKLMFGEERNSARFL